MRTIDEALKLQRCGRVTEALEIYQEITTASPENAAAWHMLGVTEHQLGQHHAALLHIDRAISLDSSQAVFWNNRGAALQALDRWPEAKTCFEKAIQIRPRYADAHSNLGQAWEQLGDDALAQASYVQAIRLEPQHFDSQVRLARLLVKTGKPKQAAGCYERAWQLRPEEGDLRDEIGNFWQGEGDSEKSLLHYHAALAESANRPYTNFNLAAAYAEQDRFEEAQRHLDAACRLAPSQVSWPLSSVNFCPAAFARVEDLDGYRATLANRLDDLRTRPLRPNAEELLSIGFYPPFALGFQGRANRVLKEKYAALCRQWLTPMNHDWLRTTGKPRVGFIVTQGHEGNFLRSAGGLVQYLDGNKFEVVLICAERSQKRLLSRIGRANLTVVPIPSSVQGACAAIRSAACDALFHWEVGSDPLNYLLPFYRLAPLQFTSWGTQVTSGLEEIDFYLSSKLIEIETADEHYTEQLWRFEGLMTYQRPVTPPPPTTKSYFGYDDRPLYVCPQTVLKLHPEQDALFAEVLRRDPRGRLVIKVGRHERPAEVVRQRMRRALPDVVDRIEFVPWQSHEDHYRLLDAADVILDTMHFSSGSSSYDMWSLHRPIVTLPGEYNVGRYTLACYRKLGFMDLVAHDVASYAEIATRLANDHDWRHACRATLADRAPLLFEDRSAVRELETFLEMNIR